MGVTNQVDKTRMMGTAAFKKEINHLLYSASHADHDDIESGWNCRDHALVMALMLKGGGHYPKIANGKCMFVQGPVAGNPGFRIGQEEHYKTGHNWLVHAKFGLIDVSPFLQTKEHSFRAPFFGIFNRVWLPQGKDRATVVLCHSASEYEAEIKKANRAMAHATAIYLHENEQEVTDKLIQSPFKFLNSKFSTEIKSRFGADFYIAVAKHLHDFVLGAADSLISQGKVKAWGSVVDAYRGR